MVLATSMISDIWSSVKASGNISQIYTSCCRRAEAAAAATLMLARDEQIRTPHVIIGFHGPLSKHARAPAQPPLRRLLVLRRLALILARDEQVRIPPPVTLPRLDGSSWYRSSPATVPTITRVITIADVGPPWPRTSTCSRPNSWDHDGPAASDRCRRASPCTWHAP
jgi:hypothetical protein